MERPEDSAIPERVSVAGVVVVSAYIAAQMLSDIMSLKIARVGGFSIDAGTFIYPLTFTLRDLVHKLLGRVAARTVIITAAAANLVMAGLLAFTAWLPPDPTWTLQREFAAVLTPVWRIVIASIIADITFLPSPVSSLRRWMASPSLFISRVRFNSLTSSTCCFPDCFDTL